MQKSKLAVLGFDHHILDKRITLKDLVSLSKKFKNIRYITKHIECDDNDLDKFEELLPTVELVRVKKTHSGIKARYKFEKDCFHKIMDFDPGIVYVHGTPFAYPLMIKNLKKFKPGIKIIMDIHEFEPDFFMEKKFLLSYLFFNIYKLFYMINSKYVDDTFCATPHIKNFLEYYGFNNVHLKMNMATSLPVRNELKSEKSRYKEFAIVGGMFRDRGVHIIIEIIAKVNEISGDQYSLALYGKFYDKEYEQECKELIEKYNIPYIDYGFLFYDKLLVELQKSTLVFMDIEKKLTVQGANALANKLFDATTCGVPIIYQKNVNFINDLKLEKDIGIGIDINSDFPLKAANEIISLLLDRKQYVQLCENCIEFAKQNNWEKFEAQFLKVFE